MKTQGRLQISPPYPFDLFCRHHLPKGQVDHLLLDQSHNWRFSDSCLNVLLVKPRPRAIVHVIHGSELQKEYPQISRRQ